MSNKINCICIDFSINALSALLSDSRIYIPVLVNGSISMEQLKGYKDRIGRIYHMYPFSYDQFFKNVEADYKLDFDDLKKHKNAQLCVERFMNRHLSDINEVDYRYGLALKFWLMIFRDYEIDCVLSTRAEHGDLNDAIVYSIAKENNVPCYIADIQLATEEVYGYALKKYHNNSFTFLNLKKLTDHADIQRYCYDKDCSNRSSVSLSQKLKNGKYFNIDLRVGMLKDFFRCFYGCKRLFKKVTRVYKSWDRLTASERFKNYKYTKKLKKIYDKISDNVSLDEKYVFYAVHFEPEATILNRGTINNQLLVIRMLADNLPEGCKLYVKEHPLQFAIENKSISYCFNNLSYFKSEQFYAEILRMKNVKLVKLDVPSEDLIKNSMACATICGTVGLEAVVENKPLLLFSKESSFLNLSHDVYSINSEQDLLKAWKGIEDNPSPKYDDLGEIVKSFLFEIETKKINQEDRGIQEKYKKIFFNVLEIGKDKNAK